MALHGIPPENNVVEASPCSISPEAALADDLEPGTREFYGRALRVLTDAGVPFLVGGAYALTHYAGILRRTKDLDIFVRRQHCEDALDVLAAEGFETVLAFPHWLGKAFSKGHDLLDVIFSSGNGLAEVDDAWFEHAGRSEIFGVEVLICPPEEMIWAKAFIMERERFDGADVAHVLRCYGEKLDWGRLLARFGQHWRVLLSQLILFGFIYPTEKDRIPSWVLHDLISRLSADAEAPPPSEKICRGTLLSRAQYLVDIERAGYEDARLQPSGGSMTPEEIAHWTAAIDRAKSAV
ncbi:nucleotidyltransferase [Polyangium aurulentum]|uniref:nucleotidyltransferase n=1 Tax=Polyangium aurulentum TaxID=2567896 RepID=UPI0010ADB4E7|nr:nucleotidyltransferase [Polyangium aurulentum]UQA58783.1 nucleotidyltransferase family protein [Polyangium aurulentum]